MGVERGVATRMAQVVWPMMIVTVTNFEGFTRQQFCKNVHFRPFSPEIHIFAKLLPSEALKICRSNYHHRYMTRNRIGNHPRTPIDTIQKFACNPCFARNYIVAIEGEQETFA